MKTIIDGHGRNTSETTLTIDNDDLDKDFVRITIKQDLGRSVITCLKEELISALQAY
jgi:hypothetical protein